MIGAALDLPSAIKSDDDLNRVAASWIRLTRAIAAVSEEKAVRVATAVLARAAVRKKELADELVASQTFYEPLAERYAAGRLKTSASRTYDAALIEVAFVACSTIKVEILDKTLATPFVLQHCPEAIDRKPVIKLSAMTTAFRAQVAKMTKAALERAGLGVVLPHDNVHFTLKAPL